MLLRAETDPLHLSLPRTPPHRSTSSPTSKVNSKPSCHFYRGLVSLPASIMRSRARSQLKHLPCISARNRAVKRPIMINSLRYDVDDPRSGGQKLIPGMELPRVCPLFLLLLFSPTKADYMSPRFQLGHVLSFPVSEDSPLTDGTTTNQQPSFVKDSETDTLYSQPTPTRQAPTMKVVRAVTSAITPNIPSTCFDLLPYADHKHAGCDLRVPVQRRLAELSILRASVLGLRVIIISSGLGRDLIAWYVFSYSHEKIFTRLKFIFSLFLRLQHALRVKAGVSRHDC